jgi:hypothetical protein
MATSRVLLLSAMSAACGESPASTSRGSLADSSADVLLVEGDATTQPGEDAEADRQENLTDAAEELADVVVDASGDGTMLPDALVDAGGDGSVLPDAEGGSPPAGPFCPSCGTDQTNCWGRCVSTADPAFGCSRFAGGLCVPCDAVAMHGTPTCSDGGCAVAACNPGWGDCDGNPQNGCETDLTTSDHCGSCSTSCGDGGLACVGSACGTCSPPDTLCSDGCFDLTSSSTHCGACSAGTCAPPETCVQGSCTEGGSCAQGQAECGGVCVDPNSNARACGATCTGCPSGGSVGAFLTRNLGTAACADGVCLNPCPSGWLLCGGTCVASNSESNCGGCGNACGSGQACLQGACVTPPNTSLVTGLTSAGDVAVDDSRIYWTDSGQGTVGAADKNTGATTSLATGQADPVRIVSDGVYAYWSNNQGGAIMRARGDGTGTPQVVATANSPWGVAVAGDSVYWADQGTHSFCSAPKDGSGSATCTSAVNLGPDEVASDGIYVFGTNVALSSTNSSTVQLGGPATSAEVAYVSGPLTVGAGLLVASYAEEAPGGGIASTPLNGSASQGYGGDLTQGPASYITSGMANDGCAVYFSNGSSSVFMWMVGANDPFRILDWTGAGGRIVVDSTSLYWAGGTYIGKAPLPR